MSKHMGHFVAYELSAQDLADADSKGNEYAEGDVLAALVTREQGELCNLTVFADGRQFYRRGLRGGKDRVFRLPAPDLEADLDDDPTPPEPLAAAPPQRS